MVSGGERNFCIVVSFEVCITVRLLLLLRRRGLRIRVRRIKVLVVLMRS